MAKPKIVHLGAGLELYDDGALSQEQQTKLKEFKESTKLKNEKYLREHPEIDCLIALFLQEVFIKQPENLLEFSADFFMRPYLRQEVQLMLIKRYPPNIRYFEKYKEHHDSKELMEFMKDTKFWTHMQHFSVPPTPRTPKSRSFYSSSGETIDVGLESILTEEELEEEEAEEELDLISEHTEVFFKNVESDSDSN